MLVDLFQSVQIVEEKESKTTQPLCKSYEAEIQLFRSLASESDAEHLKSLVDQIISGNKDSIEAVVLSPDSNKAHRTVSCALVFHMDYVTGATSSIFDDFEEMWAFGKCPGL